MIDLTLIKYLSFKKIFNILKIYFGYFFSIIFKRVFIYGYPFSFSIEPTNKCNLKCLECPTGNGSSKRGIGYIDIDLYKKIIDEIEDYTIYQMLYFQGEPFLNPDIFKLIRYADDNKIITSTSTNGHFLNTENNEKIIQSGLKKLIVSVDGTTQETYEKYRIGGNLESVLNGIEDLIHIKRKLKSKYPLIIIQFLVLKHNEHQLKEIKKIFKNPSEVKIELKSAQIESFKINAHLLPSVQKYSRYFKTSSGYKIKNKLMNRCFRIWSTMVVTWEGIVIPCCFDKTLNFKIGDLNKGTILNLWKSPEFMLHRRNVLKNRKKISICRNCTEGLSINNK